MSDSLGQMVVVPDDKWEYMITLLRDDYLNPNQELQFIETDQGPFIYLPEMHYLPNGTNENGIYEFPFTPTRGRPGFRGRIESLDFGTSG